MRIAALWSSLLILCTAAPALAYGPGDSVDYYLQAGLTRFYGDLSRDPHAPSWGLLARRQSAPADTMIGPVSSYVEVAVQGLHTVVEGRSPFPFHAQAPLSFVNVEFAVAECFLATSVVHPCLGIGGTEMTLDGQDNEQNYGAPVFKLELQHGESHGLLESFTVQYSLVPQTVETKQSDFSMVSYLVGIGWRFTPGRDRAEERAAPRDDKPAATAAGENDAS